MADSFAFRLMVRLFVAAATVLPAHWSIAQDGASVDLARRYANLRPSVLRAPEATGHMKPEDFRSALSALSAAAMQQYRRGADWNPNHPDWKRIAEIIESDVRDAVDQLTNAPWVTELEKKINEGFILGIAQRLDQGELNDLVKFYSSTAGMQLARIQQQMFGEVMPTVSRRQMQEMSGSKPAPVDFLKDSDVEGKQVVSLFDEWVRIQWSFADPGPKGDRSGLQAIPFLVLIAVQTHHSRYVSQWRSIPEQDRSAILLWRESQLGKKEREVLSETAKDLKSQVDLKAVEQQLVAIFGSLDQKWRALVQSAR